VVLTVNAGFDIFEGVAQRLIRRVGQADQAFRLGGGPAVQTSLNSRQTMIRILFVFDPRRSAVLLTAGDKTGQWKAWYERAIPHAEELYAVYLKVPRIPIRDDQGAWWSPISAARADAGTRSRSRACEDPWRDR
jgi:hypothetical protein